MSIQFAGIFAGLALVAVCAAEPAGAAQVTIARDDWDIAHIHGHSDADAVYGMIYAQAEDDFNRIETNYLTALGRLAEAEGESKLYQDLRQRLFINPAALQATYASSPAWIKSLMDAWAGGLNHFLATHPGVKPRVLRHFEPWMALSFSEGSVGGDIERADIGELTAFYGHTPVRHAALESSVQEPSGSNGIAIAPANTRDHHALLLINPHTSFFFRAEQQVSSDEGLNAYGAATWGQFFIYQGFNAHAGWMHTTSGVDSVDRFAETIVQKDGKLFYRYGAELRSVASVPITVAYKTATGTLAQRSFTTYRTHHGPVIAAAGGKWISIALMNTPLAALEQSYLRTKTTDYASFMKVAELRANSSNNTVFADDKGNIATLLPQFIPRRNTTFDYTKPVDGADPASDWHGLHTLNEAPHLLDPATGWLFNTNNWPYSDAGPDSPRAQDYPSYMDRFGENPRGIHATLLLTGHHDFTLDSLVTAAYDSYLPAFAGLIPKLAAAYDALPATDPRRAALAPQIEALRHWNNRWSAASTETSLAVFWGEALWALAKMDPDEESGPAYEHMANHTTATDKLTALAQATARLTKDFGTWRTPWGDINRFQRLTDDIAPKFTDAGTSIPVPFTSAHWGSLASFGAKRYPGTRRYYGTAGNSFVAAVEFGPRVRARAITAGGESGDPASPHFNDQAARYAAGNLRPVYFYPDELAGHITRRYTP